MRLLAGVFAALLGLPTEAMADDDVPVAPRPPTLPELTHPDYEISGETTVGVVTPSLAKAVDFDSSAATAVIQRFGVEIPLRRDPRVYLGSVYEVALGTPPGGGELKLVPGNLDLYGRIVWATRTGMTFGGGLGVLVPSAQFGATGDAANVAEAAQAVRPWDNAFFLNDTTTVHAFVDVRAVAGSFAIQFREGMEGSIGLGAEPDQVAAIAQLYLGYRLQRYVGVGLEAFETYLIYSKYVANGSRATFTISPSVRLMTPYVQPVLGFITSVGDPLFGFGSVDGFWALRVGASVVWDPGERRVRAEPTGL